MEMGPKDWAGTLSGWAEHGVYICERYQTRRSNTGTMARERKSLLADRVRWLAERLEEKFNRLHSRLVGSPRLSLPFQMTKA
jgi:hypothetical protein